ncbi:MAG: NAD-dependent epimerase/dehydratase family protein [Planctomycetota bacterium]
MRALLSGGAGFVGANLVRALLAAGHEVHLLVRPARARWRLEEVRERLHLHEVPDLDDPRVDEVVRAVSAEWVFHLAAYGNAHTQRDAARIVSTNVLGTTRLLEAALGAGCAAFVHTGSSSEYGARERAMREDDRLEPNSHYALSKAYATQLGRQRARETGARVVTLRLYSVYGPWEAPERLIPTLIREGRAGRLPPLVAPETGRDFVHVDDVVRALLLATRAAPGAVLNVGSGVQTTIREAVELCRAHFGLEVEPEWGSLPSRRWDTSVWLSDPGRIEAELGWRAELSFAEGFRRTAEWAADRAVGRLPRQGSGDPAVPP